MMRAVKQIVFTLIAALSALAVIAAGADEWIRPVEVAGATPIWGLKNGIQVGLWPTPGPRGLIRIYAPYAGVDRPHVINFVSIEPVANRSRGQSELERGLQSGQSGLEFGTADTLEEAARPRDSRRPALGKVTEIDGRPALTFFVVPEPFRNGSRPIVQVILWKDRPREVTFRLFTAPESAPMYSCVLSATMGNFARLRRLRLKDSTVTPAELWPIFQPDRLGFARWKAFPRERISRDGGRLVAWASQDEENPGRAEFDPRVNWGWHYHGKRVVQYWKAEDRPGTEVRVNARRTYWMSDGPIPGGIAFENFEMEAPFRAGQEFTFGVEVDKRKKGATPAGPRP